MNVLPYSNVGDAAASGIAAVPKTQQVRSDITKTRTDLGKEPEDGNQVEPNGRGRIRCRPVEVPIQDQTENKRSDNCEEEQQGAPEFAKHQVTASGHQPCHNDRGRPSRKRELPGFIKCYRAVGKMGREVLGQGVSRLQ